ncbi:MAG TPA: DUF2000 domain-containing protein [Aliidongia sp.]|uniref:DUF2000 domain-containing protein n=1 Tax=Aliidongia sp. TaxID=1914230 RepID=UPI002DDD2301|nr:DUF2000 domain-containing protein [Aliidongia sp.]HEV2675443.1 DUF2000 domain-containing protein [Aliidongia sp.]
MRFETKIAVALRADLPVWQKLNVTAFTVSGLAATDPAMVGEPYEDASGRLYLPMFRQPVLVFAGDAADLRRAYERATERGIRMAIFTEELFSTGHDEANRAAVKAVASADLNLVGLALRGDRKDVDKILKGLSLHA